jgi:hypothetical protein
VLARAGKVYAAASEDMDTLCFDSPILLRHLTFSEQRKEPIQEIHLDKALEGMGMDRNQVTPADTCLTAAMLTISAHTLVYRPLHPARM